MHQRIAVALIAAFTLLLSTAAGAEEPQPKTIAIGDVDVGLDVGGQKAYDVQETIQLGLKKELEKKSKGRYAVTIVSPAVVAKGSEPPPAELPEMPTDRAPTQKELAQYLASMQQWQKQMTGQVKAHKPVQADAYFDLKVVSGMSGFDTSGAAGTIRDFAGVTTSAGDLATKVTKVHLVATMRDPQTGALLDKHTAKASSVKFRNVAGATSYDYGSDEMTHEHLFASAIKECAKWIGEKVE